MKKVLSIAMSIAIMLSLTLETFAVTTNETADTAETTETTTADLVAYNGTIEELPDYIEDSYNENKKAESIDIYDEDPFSFTTNNTDGTKTVEIFQTPIKYVEDEEIKFIDTKLEELSIFNKLSSKYIYECTKAPVKSFFPTHIKDGISITNDEYEIKCYPNIESKKLKLKDIFSKSIFSKPTLDKENILSYENVFDNNDIITYTPVSTGVKEEIIIEEYNGNNIYEFTVELKDLEPLYLSGDSIPLIDKSTGEEVAAISQIDMRDSSQGIAFNTSLFNKIELTKIDGDIYNLKIILDEEFLTNESTVYPVIVDPTLTFNADPIYDAPVFSGYPSTNFNSNTYNVVGYHNSTYGEGIAFIKINNIQNYIYINPGNITSAYLKVYEGSGKTSSATVGVYEPNSTWSNTSITYKNMPTLNSSPSSSITISSSGWYNFNIKNFIKNWLNNALQDGGKPQDNGLALKMTKTGVSSRHFCSANNSSYPPSIVINYTEDTSVKSGNYFIRTQYNPNKKAWNFLYADNSNSNVIQYEGNGNNYQVWKVTNLGNGYYTLHSKGLTTHAIGVASSTPTNGTNVGLYTSSAGNRIKFRIIKNADGTYRILSACGNKTMSLDVCGPSDVSGANIQTWQYLGVSQHRWKFYVAAPCGKLSYWNINSDASSYFTNKHLKIYVEKSNNISSLIMTKTNIKLWVANALKAWEDIGVTYDFTTSSSDCDIYIKGATRNEVYGSSEEIAHLTADAVTKGFDNGSIGDYVGRAYSPDGWKKIYTTEKKVIYLIWDTEDDDSYGSITENYSTKIWKLITMHEIGHALGFEGHTKEYTVMTPYWTDAYDRNNFSPSQDEINHLKQFYDKVS